MSPLTQLGFPCLYSKGFTLDDPRSLLKHGGKKG